MKNINKTIVILILTIMILGNISGVVDAQDWDEAMQEINILPSDDIMTGPGDYNNIANDSFIKEHTLIDNDVDIDGVYWGPYAACGEFQWDKSDSVLVVTTSTFNFTSYDIMNGASEFWVRIPITWQTGLEYIIVSIETENPPNIMSVTADGTTNNFTVYGTYGTYFRYTMPVFPNSNVTVTMQVETTDIKLDTRMTIEKCQEDTNTSIEFVKVDNQGDLVYNYTEIISEIYFAWAFIFTEGMGNYGHCALRLPFYDVAEDAYLLGYHTLAFDGNDTDDTFISLYIPFRQPNRELVDWRIEINFTSAAAVGLEVESEFNGGGKTITFWISNTENFLLCSTPLNITGNTTITFIKIKVSPDKEVSLLLNHWSVDGPWNYINNRDPIKINHLNWFYVLRFTDGQWAEITPTHDFHIYDFGWGKGYRFPGDAAIYFFLNNETSILLRGNLAGLRSVFAGGTPPNNSDAKPWYEALWLSIKNLGEKVRGWLKWVWDGIQQLGNWIYSLLIGLKDWLITIVHHVKELVTNMITALPYVAPFIAIMTVVRVMSPSDEYSISGSVRRGTGQIKGSVSTRRAKEKVSWERKSTRSQRKIKKYGGQ